MTRKKVEKRRIKEGVRKIKQKRSGGVQRKMMREVRRIIKLKVEKLNNTRMTKETVIEREEL